MGEDEPTLEQKIDAMYAENDKRAFEIMHRIAALAIEQAANGLQ